MRIIQDYVLVRLNIQYDMLISMKRQTKSGLLIDTSYDQSGYVCRNGEVVAVCDRLGYDKTRIFEGSMLWDTDIEVKVGDTVICKYLHVLMALGHYGNPTIYRKQMNTYINLDGEVGIFIKYSHLILAIRNKDIIMLNGYILVEPENIDLSTDKIYVAKQLSKTTGIVRYIGSMNKEYAFGKEDDLLDVKAGNKIEFKSNNAIYLESWNDKLLDKNYYYMQRKDIKKLYL